MPTTVFPVLFLFSAPCGSFCARYWRRGSVSTESRGSAMASRSMQSALANYSRLFTVVFTCDDLQRRQTDGSETTSPLFTPVMIWRGRTLMKVRQLHCANPTILNCFGQLTERQGASKGRRIVLPSCASRQVPKCYSSFPLITSGKYVIILLLISNIITKFKQMYTSA